MPAWLRAAALETEGRTEFRAARLSRQALNTRRTAATTTSDRRRNRTSLVLQLPGHWVGRDRFCRVPLAGGQEHELSAAEVDDVALAADQRAGRGGVGRAVLAADLVEHQLGVVVELDGKPVPALLAFAQGGAAELVVHPGLAVAVCSVHAATEFQARHRVVVSGVPGPFRLDAHAVLSVDRRRLA